MEDRVLIKKIRLFLPWQDEQEEQWLSEMAQSGWHLVKFNLAVYTFEKGEREDIIYKLDYQTTTKQDFNEYLQLYADLGWEHVTRFGDWHYFRTQAAKSTFPEIYSDNDGKIQKYRRVRQMHVIVLMADVSIFTTFSLHPVKINTIHLIQILLGAAIFLLGYCIYGLTKKIQLLERS